MCFTFLKGRIPGDRFYLSFDNAVAVWVRIWFFRFRFVVILLFFFFFIFRVKLTKKLIVSTEIENFVGTPVGNGFFRKLRKMLCCGTGEQLAGRSMRTERIPGTGYSYTIPPLPRYRSAMTSVPGFISSLLAISGSKNVSYTAYI